MSVPEAEPYERLARMIERELELASAGQFDELDRAVTARGELLATLSVPPPDSARVAFERARLLHERLLIEVQRAQESIGLSLAHLRAVKRAAHGYRPRRAHRYTTTA